MYILDFLRRTRAKCLDLVKQASVTQPLESVNLVFGNEACDLDSTVSALIWAWFLTHLQSPDKVTRAFYVPILNIPENMFRLKTECVHLLKKFGVSQKDLIFQDTVDLQTLFSTNEFNIKITLVDHHVLPRSDEHLYPLVTEVIDHRVQARTFEPNVKVEIATVGSCVTLIAERMIQAIDDEKLIINDDEMKEMTSLITGPILLDTVNLRESAGKVTERDLKVIRRLWKSENNPELSQFFFELTGAKYSVDGLTGLDLILKDAKIIENADGNTKVFLSTLHDELENFLQHDDAISCLPSLLSSKKCILWLGLAPVKTDEAGNQFKPILLYSQDDEVKTKVNRALSTANNPPLEILTEETNGLCHELLHLRMYNIKASRKQVLPVVQQTID